MKKKKLLPEKASLANQKLQMFYKKQMDNPSNIEIWLANQISYHYKLWNYYCFGEFNYDEAKRHAAVAGMCADWIDDKSDLIGGSFHVLKRPIFLILMSNYKYLYERFKNWQIPYGLPSKSYGRVWGERCMLYYIINERYDILLKDYEYALSLKGEINWNQRYAPYLAIMEKDKDALVSSCVELCSLDSRNEMKKYGEPYTDFYQVLPTIALKLAWILGMEVEIDNPYIPMDLMPVTPLDHYEVPYFFLDGYQGEIPKGYREAERSRQEKRNANKKSPKTFWKDFIIRNKAFQKDTSGEKRAIQYVNEKGDVILQELTNPEIGNQLLLVLFHNGHETWKKIPDNWTWDKKLFKSAKEAFFVKTYRDYGYSVTKNAKEDWEISWQN